jgi:outer membrane lipoprotein-sorting protein
MRLSLTALLTFLPLFPALAQESDEAGKLFRKMEKKLSEAKSLRVALEGTAEGIEDLRGTLKYKGTMVLAQGNKARFEMEMEIEGKKRRTTFVSDGTKTIGDMAGEAGKRREDTPKMFFEVTIGFFKHGGPVAGYVFSSSGPEGKQTFARFKPSAFKLGPKEKIGQRQAQVIEYKLTLETAPKEAGKLSLSEKLWLDVETNLPLKRVFSGKLKKMFTYTENYSEFTVNPKLDARLFELPK